MPENLEICELSCSTGAILKAFTKPGKWMAPWIKTRVKNKYFIVDLGSNY